jgi:dethiobiotin synthetase/adenosylmethionine--8-amino-7-oxononanoate aminotransferase
VWCMDKADHLGYSSHAALSFLTDLRQTVIEAQQAGEDFAPFQIHSRPLGNVVYVMTSLLTKPAVMRAMERTIMGKLQ